MPAKKYPDWVQKLRPTGHSVKCVNGNYYLYKHTSKRVPGKKYPVPVDTYVGVITPSGVIYSDKRKLDVTDAVVREFGFSNTLLKACPDSWKRIQGDEWEERLISLIVAHSPNSYLIDSHKIKSPEELRIQAGTLWSSLKRKLSDDCKATLSDLQSLDTIFVIKMGNKRFLSHVSDEQNEILKRLDVTLEVH